MPLSELLGSHLAPSNLRCRAGEPAAQHEACPPPLVLSGHAASLTPY